MEDNLGLGLDPEQYEELEVIAGLGRSNEEIALYYGIDFKKFQYFAEDKESLLYYHLTRGRLNASIKEELAIFNKTSGGSVEHSKRLQEIRRNRSFKVAKDDVFGVLEKGQFEAIQSYILGTNKKSLNKDEQLYIETLTMISSLDRKYGRAKTIDFLSKGFGLKSSRCTELYDEAINLFYADRNVEMKALRHKKAERLEEMARVAFEMAETSRDLEVASNIEMQAAKLRGMDKPEVERLPKEVYRKPYVVYSLNPEDVGMPAVNRQEIANQIDLLEIPESEKIRLRADARIETVQLKQYLSELQEESKTQ
jgi:hypothetical protein